MDTKTVTPAIAIREFFGYKPGEGLKEFSAELKALSEQDKQWMARECALALGKELVEAKAAA